MSAAKTKVRIEKAGPEPRKSFDKVPRWPAKRDDFHELDELACKILYFLSHARTWKTDVTPWTTIEELAERVGGSWRRTKRAVSILAALGAVRIETLKRNTRFRLIYSDPFDHEHEQAVTQTEAITDLDVAVDASVEGRSPSGLYANTADKPTRFGIEATPKTQATSDDSPAWLNEHSAPEPGEGYIAGEDLELLGQAPSLGGVQ